MAFESLDHKVLHQRTKAANTLWFWYVLCVYAFRLVAYHYIHSLSKFPCVPVAFDEDFEAELIDNRDAKTEVSLLAKGPNSELTEVSIQIYCH